MFSFLTQKKSVGFTLVEVMVSLSIFTFVATAAVGVLLTLISANSRSQDIQSAMLDLSFVLDSMTRDIRTGVYYYCSNNSNDTQLKVGGKNRFGDCNNGTSFGFDEMGGSLTKPVSTCNLSDPDQADQRVAFSYNSTDKSIERNVCNSSWVRLTAPEVEVTDLLFTLTGSDPNDDQAPLVTIYVAGQVTGKGGKATDFSLQTTVTQNLLDLPI